MQRGDGVAAFVHCGALEVLSPFVRLRSPSSNAKAFAFGRFKLWSRGSPPSVAPALARSTHSRVGRAAPWRRPRGGGSDLRTVGLVRGRRGFRR